MNIFDKDGNITREMYIFLRYNQLRNKLEEPLSESEENIYQEFNRQLKEFKTSLEEGKSIASSQLGNILNIFGFDRHYCAISGLPIIGKFYKINGKTVSRESYESWKIVQEMQKAEEIENKKHNLYTSEIKQNLKKPNKGDQNA